VEIQQLLKRVQEDGTDHDVRPTARALARASLYISAISAYLRIMTEVTVSEARARLADVVDRARVAHDPVYLTRRGRRVAAVIDADDLERLIDAAEDLADIEAARAARAEMAEGQVAIPWEQVKADLGLA
jgi:prevent-host-death family protein